MAIRSLSDPASRINSHQDLSTYNRLQWVDHTESYLAKSQSLVRIAMNQGLDDSSPAEQFYFCVILDKLLEEVRKGVEYLSSDIL